MPKVFTPSSAKNLSLTKDEIIAQLDLDHGIRNVSINDNQCQEYVDMMYSAIDHTIEECSDTYMDHVAAAAEEFAKLYGFEQLDDEEEEDE